MNHQTPSAPPAKYKLPIFPKAIVDLGFKKKAAKLPDDFVPGNYDVICGRGKSHFHHIGNRRFRVTIEMFFQRYKESKTKIDKSMIVNEVMQILRDTTPRAGFVRQLKDGKWMEVGDVMAREKVGHSFRDRSLKTKSFFMELPSCKSSSPQSRKTREKTRASGDDQHETKRHRILRGSEDSSSTSCSNRQQKKVGNDNDSFGNSNGDKEKVDSMMTLARASCLALQREKEKEQEHSESQSSTLRKKNAKKEVATDKMKNADGPSTAPSAKTSNPQHHPPNASGTPNRPPRGGGDDDEQKDQKDDNEPKAKSVETEKESKDANDGDKLSDKKDSHKSLSTNDHEKHDASGSDAIDGNDKAAAQWKRANDLARDFGNNQRQEIIPEQQDQSLDADEESPSYVLRALLPSSQSSVMVVQNSLTTHHHATQGASKRRRLELHEKQKSHDDDVPVDNKLQQEEDNHSQIFEIKRSNDDIADEINARELEQPLEDIEDEEEEELEEDEESTSQEEAEDVEDMEQEGKDYGADEHGENDESQSAQPTFVLGMENMWWNAPSISIVVD